MYISYIYQYVTLAYYKIETLILYHNINQTVKRYDIAMKIILEFRITIKHGSDTTVGNR